MVDDPIRNLVQRLVQMSPEAPPFPEEHMVQLDKRSNEFTPPPRRVGRFGWAIAGAVAVLVLIGLPAYLLGALRFGGDEAAQPTPVVTEAPPTSLPPATSIPPTTVPVVPTPVLQASTIFVLADYGDSNRPGPLLRPVGVMVPGAEADLMTETLAALVSGAWPGQVNGTSEIPVGSELLSTEQVGSTLRVDLSAAFESGGGSASMTARLAQVVFTATRFEGIDSVEFLIDGEVVDVFSAEGVVLDGPQTRDDYQDWLPLVMIEEPVDGAETTAPFVVSGISNTFEASLSYTVTDLSTGEVVADGFTTATCGTGCWGEYSFPVDVNPTEPTQYLIEAFEFSAKDGSKVNVATSTVTVGN